MRLLRTSSTTILRTALVILVTCMGIASATASCHIAHNKHHKSKHHKDCDVHCAGLTAGQASPELESACRKGCNVLVRGKLKSIPHTEYHIQFFNNPIKCDKKTEGKTLIGQTAVKTDKTGKAFIHAVVSCVCACGDDHKRKDGRRCSSCRCPNRCTFISATATRLRDGKLSDTSEFSKSIKVN